MSTQNAAQVSPSSTSESNGVGRFRLILNLNLRSSWGAGGTLLAAASAAFCVWYAWMFWQSVSPYWFHKHWTTDDSLQQLFPFHAVYQPEIFKGDLIYEAMKGYLAPLHYWISYLVTYLVGDPVMMGHWVMLIQAVLSCAFLFFAVRHAAGIVPAFVSVVWLLHTRHIMQRLTAGLPRGWAAVILTGYVYFAVTRNHRGMLLLLLAGCLLHPPATLIAAAAYGIWLLWRTIDPKTRAEFKKPLLTLLLLSPLYIAVTAYVVHRPAEIGDMVSFEQAAQMPEFQRPKGRFPFIPLRTAEHEIKSFGFQAFIGRFYNPGRFWKRNMWLVSVIVMAGLMTIGLIRRRKVFPDPLLTFLLAIFAVYFASRAFAFKLYVPNRHLQFPMGIFFVSAFSIAAWRAFYLRPREALSELKDGDAQPGFYRSPQLRMAALSAVAMMGLGWLVYAGSGNGLYGAANFNYSRNKKGEVFTWIRDNTAKRAYIAGHPTFIDAVQLFGERRGFATTETSHPFYPEYYKEIKRRLIISLKAHYAPDLKTLAEVLEPEGIDYFVFERARFYPEVLAEEDYFPPLNPLVEKLTSRPWQQYAYRQLPAEVDLEAAPYMPFKDDRAAVVDVAKLRHYLENHANKG